MFAVVLFFFGQRPQQYLALNLVASRITFGNPISLRYRTMLMFSL
jgi:hypothetical protein